MKKRANQPASNFVEPVLNTDIVDVYALNYKELTQLLKDKKCTVKDLNPSLTEDQINWIENDLQIYKTNI